MDIILDFDAVLLRGIDGSHGTIEVKNIKDLTVNFEEIRLEFSIFYDTEDPDYKAFADAYFNNTPLSLFVLDGNGIGLDADFSITKFSIEPPILGPISVFITAKLTSVKRPPYLINRSGRKKLNDI